MGRSQRADRNPGIFNQDAYGDAHYPGTGQTAQGATINPAIKAGNPPAYVYDWAGTWPSGSGGAAPVGVPPIGEQTGGDPLAVPDTPWTRHADADAWYQAYLGGQGIDGWESMSLAEKHAAACASVN